MSMRVQQTVIEQGTRIDTLQEAIDTMKEQLEAIGEAIEVNRVALDGLAFELARLTEEAENG